MGSIPRSWSVWLSSQAGRSCAAKGFGLIRAKRRAFRDATMAGLDRFRLKLTRCDLSYQFFALDSRGKFAPESTYFATGCAAGSAELTIARQLCLRCSQSNDLVVLH
jgi:hypothetical protein